MEIVETLAAYYLANKPENSDWVVLPVVNFDASFGTTSFGQKYLKQISESIMGALGDRVWTVSVSAGLWPVPV